MLYFQYWLMYLYINIFTFNYEIEIHEQYKLNFLLLPFSLILVLKIKHLYQAFDSKRLVLIIVICGLSSLILYSQSLSYSNEHFFSVAFFIICFSILALIKFNEYITIIIYILVIAYLYEFFIGAAQLFTFYSATSKERLLPHGTVQNSGVFSILIVSGLPLINYAFFHFKNENLNKVGFLKIWHRVVKVVYLKYFYLALILLSALLLSVTHSRTAIVSFFITIFIFMLNEHKNIWIKINSLKITPLIICIFFILLFGLTRFKTESLSGRVLIYKISMLHFWDDFLLGLGIGKFTWHYPEWQVNYFNKNLNLDDAFFLNAGETYLAFNEYFQIFKETGIVGMSLFLIILWLAFSSKSTSHKKLLQTCKTILISILICAVSSYPFHVNFLLFVLGFCFSVIFSLRNYKFNFKIFYGKKIVIISLALLYCCIAVFTVKGIKTSILAERWKLLENCRDCKEFNNESYYSSLYPILKNDGKFLALYGELVSLKGQNLEMAVQILEESRNRIISIRTIQELSQLYLKIDRRQAERNLIWLTKYVPNKFSYKYDLLSFYMLTNDTSKGIAVAKQIVSMPVKIPSQKVTIIQNEAINYLTLIQTE